MPERSRRRLPAALRRAVLDELPSRDQDQTAVFRTLVGSNGLTCRIETPTLVVLDAPGGLDEGESLVAGTIYPAWRRGWRNLDPDEHVYDAVSYYFHAIATYILRSRLLNCSSAIALTYRRACDFSHGSRMWEQLVGPEDYAVQSFAAAIATVVSTHGLSRGGMPATSRKRREFLAWVSTTNALDPYIHRMLYQFVRATQLRERDFYEDSVNALDSTVDVAAQFVRDRLGRRADRQRAEMVAALKIPAVEDSILGHLNALRNYFGAHPGESGWWDFRDNYADRIDEMFEAVKHLIWEVCGQERIHRLVDPDPSVWSDWFVRHAAVISVPVWFRFDGPSWKPLSQS